MLRIKKFEKSYECGNFCFTNTDLFTRSESRHWSIVLFIGTVALYAARIALPICATTVGHRYDWSKTDSGTVLSSFFWGYAATQIIGGWLADQLGGERVVTYTTLVWALLTLFTPPLFALSYYLSDQPLKWLVMLRVATGFCQGIIYIVFIYGNEFVMWT